MVTRSPKIKCFLKGKVSMSMSVELQNALLIAAPGSWSNKVSSVTHRTKSVDLISRALFCNIRLGLLYQNDPGTGSKSDVFPSLADLSSNKM